MRALYLNQRIYYELNKKTKQTNRNRSPPPSPLHLQWKNLNTTRNSHQFLPSTHPIMGLPLGGVGSPSVYPHSCVYPLSPFHPFTILWLLASSSRHVFSSAYPALVSPYLTFVQLGMLPSTPMIQTAGNREVGSRVRIGPVPRGPCWGCRRVWAAVPRMRSSCVQVF